MNPVCEADAVETDLGTRRIVSDVARHVIKGKEIG